MSATIPSTMLLSDLLKATGYNCPEDLQGKTFEEATAGGTEVVLEDNKAATITANGTVEITPTAGKDAMKKVTATVNVPSTPKEPTSINLKGQLTLSPEIDTATTSFETTTGEVASSILYTENTKKALSEIEVGTPYVIESSSSGVHFTITITAESASGGAAMKYNCVAATEEGKHLYMERTIKLIVADFN